MRGIIVPAKNQRKINSPAPADALGMLRDEADDPQHPKNLSTLLASNK
jgi:hypothetical protein